MLTLWLMLLTVGWTAMAGASPLQSQAQVQEFDQAFIDMMVPHHEGAVAMAEIARERAEHREVKDLAEDIIRSQEAEIAQMKAWRLAWYGSDQTPSMSETPMLHPMVGESAMIMAEDVQALREAPEPFDRAFIEAMIPHHQSAIDTAQLAELH